MYVQSKVERFQRNEVLLRQTRPDFPGYRNSYYWNGTNGNNPNPWFFEEYHPAGWDDAILEAGAVLLADWSKDGVFFYEVYGLMNETTDKVVDGIMVRNGIADPTPAEFQTPRNPVELMDAPAVFITPEQVYAAAIVPAAPAVIPSTLPDQEITMSSEPRFINTDERYGNRDAATLSDYQELHPEGEFEQRADGIYEWVTDRAGGHWQQIARRPDAD